MSMREGNQNPHSSGEIREDNKRGIQKVLSESEKDSEDSEEISKSNQIFQIRRPSESYTRNSLLGFHKKMKVLLLKASVIDGYKIVRRYSYQSSKLL